MIDCTGNQARHVFEIFQRHFKTRREGWGGLHSGKRALAYVISRGETKDTFHLAICSKLLYLQNSRIHVLIPKRI